MQDPGVGVVVVRAAGVGAGGGAHAVAFREAAVEGGQDPAGAYAGLGGQFLGGEVGLVEVVAAPVEELPDLLVRGAGGGRPGVGAPLGDLREPVGQQVGAAPQRQQDLRHPGSREASSARSAEETREAAKSSARVSRRSAMSRPVSRSEKKPGSTPKDSEIRSSTGTVSGRESCSIWLR